MTALRARAARSGTDALRVANPETENTMDLETLIAQWSGKAPPGFVPPAIMSARCGIRAGASVAADLAFPAGARGRP